MLISIDNKNVVISGGTSGVGRRLVGLCSKEGANVVFGGRNDGVAKEILAEVSNNKGKVVFVHTDLLRTGDCRRLFSIAKEKFGRVDGFVNYAGITPISPLDECSEDVFDSVMGVNFKAAFFCCQEAVRCFRESGGGSVVLMGSPHAWNGEKDRAAYACSKGAMLTLMNHIAHNYAEEKIRCNYLTMGWTLTEGEIDLRRQMNEDVEKYFEAAASSLPMKRLCTTSDYDEMIIYLLSDSSAMVNGSVMQVTGGLFI